MAEPPDNRAARRREVQRDLRSFVERLSRIPPWLSGAGQVRCKFCNVQGAVGPKGTGPEHRDGCLWLEVREWLARHQVQPGA